MRNGLVFSRVFSRGLSRVSSRVTIIGFLMLVWVLPVQAIFDPTRPPGLSSVPATAARAVEKGPRWVLKSTLVSPQRRTAVINDRVVGLGDRVRGATVIEISPSRVRLRSRGADITLVMLKKNIKTLSRQATTRQIRQ